MNTVKCLAKCTKFTKINIVHCLKINIFQCTKIKCLAKCTKFNMIHKNQHCSINV